ncbi:MAG TPA: helix-turn-helix transcriptional regulator, partial [Saprospiraceae bacterium]|nr:helix-turn-helix transcriptional regulator [Saprospiraceae bacterium]
MTTSSIIQKLRERKNLSREQVADRLSVSKRTYDRIEQGERDLSLSEASILSELFDVPVEALIAKNTTYINHGNVSVGVGSGRIENLILDAKLIEEIKEDLKKLHEKLDKLLGIESS